MKAILVLAFIGLALSTASGAAASLTWFLILAIGIFFAATRKRRSLHQPLINPTAFATDTPSDIALIWVWICVAAALFMMIPTAYWGGPWPERHPQWRLLLAALGCYWIVKHAYLSDHQHETVKQTLLVAGSIGLIIALLGVLLFGASDFAPSNRIPWMAATSTLACATLALSFAISQGQQRLLQIGVFCSLVTAITAIISGVRGSWGLLLVLPIALYFLAQNPAHYATKPTKKIVFFVTISLFATLSLASLFSSDSPLERAQTAFRELSQFMYGSGSPHVYESSTGIRLAMYSFGLRNALESGLIGIGHDAHKALLQDLFRELSVSGPVTKLAHYHNDILNPWVEFGLMGLAGYLVYFLGLVYIAFALRHTNRVASVGFTAVAITHILTGLTNVNFAHNYYPMMLSISVFILIISMKDPTNRG